MNSCDVTEKALKSAIARARKAIAVDARHTQNGSRLTGASAAIERCERIADRLGNAALSAEVDALRALRARAEEEQADARQAGYRAEIKEIEAARLAYRRANPSPY